MRWLLFPLCSLILCSSVFGFDPATQDDSRALVRHFKKPEKPLPPFENGKFEPRQGETITLMGGTDMYRMQEHGDLEALLHREFPKKNLRIRNIAWPADTVYRQQRPMFFHTEKGDTKEGSLPDQREKIEPGIFVLQFGKMESFEGRDGISQFENVFESLLDSLSAYSPRIVVLAPTPFSDVGPAGELAESRNANLAIYTAKLKGVAARNRVLFRESFEELCGEDTSNATDALVEQILRKNKLWNQYYRPTNWAFLFGDRQHVPSSRDHRDANRRWFVEELEKLPPLINQADEAIWKEAQR